MSCFCFRFRKQKWRINFSVIIAYMNYTLDEQLNNEITNFILNENMKILNLRDLIPPSAASTARPDLGIPKLLQSTPAGRALTLSRQGSSAFTKYRKKNSITIENLRKGSLVNVLGQIGSIVGNNTAISPSSASSSSSSSSTSASSDERDDESALHGAGALCTLQMHAYTPMSPKPL